jgi:hypothetical protein
MVANPWRETITVIDQVIIVPPPTPSDFSAVLSLFAPGIAGVEPPSYIGGWFPQTGARLNS